MKRSIKSLIGFTLGATDGEVGKVKDFYFDDDTWTIRYLVVDTGDWLSGRVVLISPEALFLPDWKNNIFPVDLTKDQVENSPDIDTEVPVSRQEEIKLRDYYPWVAYWGSGYYGMGPTTELEQGVLHQNDPRDDQHLRSAHKVTGYNIKTSDGEIGNVGDFLVDEDTWKIEFMLVDISHWFSGKKVLLSLSLIKHINWETSSVTVDTTVAAVKSSPEYDPEQEVTEVYTLALHDHYHNSVNQ